MKRFIKTVIRKIHGIILIWRYHVKFDTKGINNLKTPYILISNHPSTIDLSLITIPTQKIAGCIVNDKEYDRHILKSRFGFLETIPKVIKDETMRPFWEMADNNGIICMFPEGTVSWNGSTGEPAFKAASLIKELSLPVVAAVIKGACLSKPRWARKTRRGEIQITYSQLLSTTMVEELSEEDILRRVYSGIYHDEYDMQKREKKLFKGRRLAENIELFLFTCPMCKMPAKMKSRKNTLFCGNCGFSVDINEYGFFENPSREPFYFITPKQWDQWQAGNFNSNLVDMMVEKSEELIFSDERVVLIQGIGSLSNRIAGRLELYPGKIAFIGRSADYIFKIDNIACAEIQYKNLLQFYYEETHNKFVFRQPHVSGYKWLYAISTIKAIREA